MKLTLGVRRLVSARPLITVLVIASSLAVLVSVLVITGDRGDGGGAVSLAPGPRGLDRGVSTDSPWRTAPDQQTNGAVGNEEAPDAPGDERTDDPADADPPPAQIAGVEEVTWTEGTAWWPHRPLLRAVPPPPSAPAESVFIVTDQDPSKELTPFHVVYWDRSTPPDRFGLRAMIEAGAFQVSVTYYPPGEPLGWQGFQDETVVVRGRTARVYESRKTERSNVNLRRVKWEDALESGAVLQWIIYNHPDLYTLEETVAFIDALVEIR